MSGLSIFAGNSNPLLGDRISEYLAKPLGKLKVNRFSDGEIQVEILENVRKQEIFVIQSTCKPVNDHLVELLLLIDAFKRSSASRITPVIPLKGLEYVGPKMADMVREATKLAVDKKILVHCWRGRMRSS
ncbi:MAG: ribose-phosphate pyrophosphokinase-like domain-containing protein, partial [Desulfotignum sp.]